MSICVNFWTAALLLGLNSACGVCGNTEVSRLVSPDGRLDAVIFERSCGATTDFTTQISIVRKGDAIANDAGNAFIADAKHGPHPAPIGVVPLLM